jgi:cell division protein FtsB
LVGASPFLLAPFGLLLGETFLQMQTYQNDYHVNALRRETRALRTEVESLKARAADLEASNRLEKQALRMGMVEPEREQIVLLEDRIDLDALRYAHLQARGGGPQRPVSD